MSDPISKLQSDRDALLASLAATGDMRRGSISEVFRSCGKPTCACADPDHPGHGPYYAFTKKVNGKTKTLQLRPGPVLAKVEAEVNAYREFRATCDQLIDINNAICDARPLKSVDDKKKLRSSPHSVQKSSPKSKR